jgi:chitin synthase
MEVELDPRGGMGDLHGPYPGSTQGNCGDVGAFGATNQHLPPVANASPFQRADLYDDEFDVRKSLRNGCDKQSNYSSQRDVENCAPSRNISQSADGEGALLEKEALAGEIQDRKQRKYSRKFGAG